MLYKRIVEQRHKLKLSKRELALYLGVSEDMIEKWEVGISMPDIVNLNKLSELFKISKDELLEDESSQSQFRYYTVKKTVKEYLSNAKVIAFTAYMISFLGLFTLFIISRMEPIIYIDEITGRIYHGFKAYYLSHNDFTTIYYISFIGFILSTIYLLIPEAKLKNLFQKKI